ncbi:hypothetical protein BLTE_08190 [Blastochloris tepida]|uniref:Uncharacterized protein n=2 Tax=Blastochloris tepida TaxID=2233851 RepID=A0A348FXV1_9HYPH|nr:hypothetical protein BLTE_08190 [Blastochloris tepida]
MSRLENEIRAFWCTMSEVAASERGNDPNEARAGVECLTACGSYGASPAMRRRVIGELRRLTAASRHASARAAASACIVELESIDEVADAVAMARIEAEIG